MSTIKFRLAAKTDMGLVRTNNEDNFQAAADLSSGQMRWVNNEICSLGEKGALLVVADGMGGSALGQGGVLHQPGLVHLGTGHRNSA